MTKDDSELIPLSSPTDIALDISAGVASIAPWVGGPVAQVLSGISLGRKLSRVREVLLDMAEKIKALEDAQSHEYVRSDDFAELLEKTLRQAADERSEEKRAAYAAFLAGDIASPGAPYDEKVRILQTLEQLQGDHIRMLKAMLQSPQPITSTIGSLGQTFQRRLPDINADRIRDLAQELTDLRLATLERPNTMMTANGAEHLENYLTPYGKRFLACISYRGTASGSAA